MTEQIPETPPESYALAEFGVTRASDRASIPESDRNRDWQAYQEWLSAGNTADPIPTPVIDPTVAERKALAKSAQDKIATTSALTANEESAMFGNQETGGA